jgi:hypothetical protein
MALSALKSRSQSKWAKAHGDRSVCRSIARSLARTQFRIGLWRVMESRSVRMGGEWYNFARR